MTKDLTIKVMGILTQTPIVCSLNTHYNVQITQNQNSQNREVYNSNITKLKD